MIKKINIACENCKSNVVDIMFIYEDKKQKIKPCIKMSGFIYSGGGATFNTNSGVWFTDKLLNTIYKDVTSDYRNCHALDPDMFGFICKYCGVPYCINCWKNKIDRFDEGFYDDTTGTCPKGHTQMISD